MKALIVAFSLLAATPVLAANADTPSQNVDKTNDAGGSTGNAQVERLNSGQLDQNQRPEPSSPSSPGASQPAAPPK